MTKLKEKIAESLADELAASNNTTVRVEVIKAMSKLASDEEALTKLQSELTKANAEAQALAIDRDACLAKLEKTEGLLKIAKEELKDSSAVKQARVLNEENKNQAAALENIKDWAESYVIERGHPYCGPGLSESDTEKDCIWRAVVMKVKSFM